jgi:hypothetical protein
MLSIRGVTKRFSLHGFLDQPAGSCRRGARQRAALAAAARRDIAGGAARMSPQSLTTVEGVSLAASVVDHGRRNASGTAPAAKGGRDDASTSTPFTARAEGERVGGAGARGWP